jgi:glutaminyl-peptide cyclotransferase
MHARRVAGAALALLLSAATCAPAFPVDGARALSRVRHQVEAGPRVPGTPGHEAIRDWIERELVRLGARVELQAFTDSTLGHPLELTNLIGHFGPANGRRILLCAHWDSRPFCDQDPDPARRGDPLPGANDGGSGVAVLLEVAELMSRTAPQVPVDLVFFDGEDQGAASESDQFCRGSLEYARRIDPKQIKAAFVFDMVGDRDLEIHPEVESARRSTNLVALVMQAARATGARHFQPAPRWDVFDDHIRLLDAGIPAADLIDFDYPAWHTSADTPDMVSGESLAEVARVAAWLVFKSPLAVP